MNTKEIRKRKGFYFCLLAFTSVLLLLLLSVVSLFWPTRRFSASERRNLASVLSFPMRELLMELFQMR